MQSNADSLNIVKLLQAAIVLGTIVFLIQAEEFLSKAALDDPLVSRSQQKQQRNFQFIIVFWLL